MIDFTNLPRRNKTYGGANGSKRSVIYQDEQYMLKFPPHPSRNRDMSYLRRLILEKEVKALPSQEIKALRTEVHKIGVNINQIARSVNAGIARAEDARRGLYLLEQVYALMYEVAKK